MPQIAPQHQPLIQASQPSHQPSGFHAPQMQHSQPVPRCCGYTVGGADAGVSGPWAVGPAGGDRSIITGVELQQLVELQPSLAVRTGASSPTSS
ncbi:MAG: hypothetical protein TH68_10665 [Candidatus Synechococcus spongiarum 142]|uniref:Uncharacterized protein n=1 Tax=Candidatus Synechococcus spongiarum 142 TaxID=1608213 RepID=A0A6N3X951_9SYNE|nr:MAG: hypothetical protein TH68_10665 [Candidatus Synechococcus spongiarum 142]